VLALFTQMMYSSSVMPQLYRLYTVVAVAAVAAAALLLLF
jgi:hypothetical protein